VKEYDKELPVDASDESVDLAIIFMTNLSHLVTEQKLLAEPVIDKGLIKKNRELTSSVLLSTLVNLKRYKC
jgi:hypothetical protein